jgi:hypothetical protein
MASSIINQFIEHLSDAIGKLSPAVSLREIEQLATKVHFTMQFGQRIYHASPHALAMCRDMNPHQVLAGIFHDIVYYQLDDGFPEHFAAVLRQVTQTGAEGLTLSRIDTGNHGMRMCADLFGFGEGDSLPLYGGMNEFLSAVVAAHCLSPYLKPADLLMVVALIAGTIPCWAHDPQGMPAMEKLLCRVREVNRELDIGLDAAAIDALAPDIVAFANRDVGGFAVDDPGVFLYTTWMLIEESNAPLAFVGVYSIRDFRNALQRMEGFLASLRANRIFHSYRNKPEADEMARLEMLAQANLEFAVRYLNAKLVAIAVIEALALETGGDAPISMLLGDLQTLNPSSDRIEDFLSMPSATSRIDSLLLDVLQEGRRLSCGGHLAASPLSAFLYLSIGMEGIMAAAECAKRMFADQIAPADFLRQLPREPLRTIIDGCSRIAISRADALHALRIAL